MKVKEEIERCQDEESKRLNIKEISDEENHG